MFRKVICICLAAAMLISLCGCTLVSRMDTSGSEDVPRAKFVAESLHVPAPLPEEPEVLPEDELQGEEEGDAAPVIEYPQIEEDDPMYGDVSEMVKGLTPVFSYFALKGEDMDLGELSAEDFWLLMAMIAAEINGDKRDADGDVTLRWEVLSDYAACFLGAYYNSKGMPDVKGVSSASSDPRSQVVSLSAMEIDGYHGRLAGFEASPNTEGFYDLYLEIYWSVIEGASAGSDISEGRVWKILLEPWPEDSDHAFAFRMISFERLENEEPEVPEDDPSADADLSGV